MQELIKKSIASKEDMELIQQYARRELSPEEIYTFNLVLCNNDVDRDFEKFSVEALEQMAKLFLGKTGIFDHSMKSSNQKARVFYTNVERVEGRKTLDGEDYYCLKARAYMLNSKENQELIDEIDTGIKKEVSVSCSVGEARCSICGTNKRKEHCSHVAGKTYGDKMCFSILNDATDAYEFSFVAVPAQREAGVTKSFCKKEDFILQDVVKQMGSGEEITLSKSQSKELFSYIEGLKEEAQLGEEYKKQLSKEVVDLFKKAFPKMEQGLFASVVSVMTTKELLGFREGMKKGNGTSQVKPQLAGAAETKQNNNSAFQI